MFGAGRFITYPLSDFSKLLALTKLFYMYILKDNARKRVCKIGDNHMTNVDEIPGPVGFVAYDLEIPRPRDGQKKKSSP